MAHSSTTTSQAHHHHDPKETRAEYIKIFKWLVILTVAEVGFVFLPLPHLVVTLLVVVASCAKAGVVGYYYMHLKQETKWLKFVALLPLIMFIYLAALGPDSSQRHFSPYFFQPERVLPEAAHHGAEAHVATETPKEVAEEAPAPTGNEVVIKDGKIVTINGAAATAADLNKRVQDSAPTAASSDTATSTAAPGAAPAAGADAAPTTSDAANEWL